MQITKFIVLSQLERHRGRVVRVVAYDPRGSRFDPRSRRGVVSLGKTLFSHFLTSPRCKWVPDFGWGRLKAVEGEDWAPPSDTVP